MHAGTLTGVRSSVMRRRVLVIFFALVSLAATEAEVRQAIEREPRNARHFYDLACALAPTSAGKALDELIRAANMGFTDFAAIEANEQLDSLREMPRFKQFLARKDQHLRRTAEG